MLAGTRRSRWREQRRGVALVEFAIAFPVVLLCILLAVALCAFLATRNTFTTAAREGGYVVSLPRVASRTAAVDALTPGAEIAPALKNDFPTVPSEEGLLYSFIDICRGNKHLQMLDINHQEVSFVA